MKKRLNRLVAILVILACIALVIGACRVVEKPEARAVRERICIDSRCDGYIYNKADLTWYNDDHGTVVAKIDGDGTGLISAPTSVGTATPAFFVDSAGVSNIFEVRDAGTPVYSVANGGAVSQTGAQDFSNAVRIAAPTAVGTATPALVVNNAGVSNLIEVQDGGTNVLEAYNGGGVRVVAPTAVGTAVPAMVVDSSGGVSNLLEVRDSATPVFTVNDGGTWASTGAGTHSAGQTVNNWAIVAAPTAIATATPAMVVDSSGVSAILEVRDGGTAVAQFLNGGTLDMQANPIQQDLGSENIGVLPSIATTSITYTAAAGGSGTVATVGDGEVWLVTKVLVNVTTDFDCTGDDATLVIGDGNDPDGFVVLADTELQAADTEGTGFAAGWQGQAAATIGAYLDANENGFIYAPSGAAETIDYLIDETSGETLTAGAATIYVFYIRLQ